MRKGSGQVKLADVFVRTQSTIPDAPPKGILMGKHDAPKQPFKHLYHGYACELCKGFWGAVQVDEGLILSPMPCFVTEGCRGRAVTLYPSNEPPPEWVPIIIEWFKPKNDFRFSDPLTRQYIENDGLFPRATEVAPEWVKGRLGYFGGLNTFKRE